MENTYFIIYLLTFLASFLLASAFVPKIINLANYFGISDDPNSQDRKIHQKPTPLLGGWSIFLSVFIVMSLIKYLGLANFAMIPDQLFWAVMVASFILMLGGSLDDKYNLKPYQQIIFPLLAIFTVLAFGLKITYITNPIGGVNNAIIYVNSFWGISLAGLWLLGMIYTTKFLDGLDGLATGIGIIASFFIFLISLRWDVFLSATGLWGLALAGACLGFLIYNWQPAKIFLGEGGSVFLGFLLGVLSIISGSKIITTLLVMGLPILDVLLVIIQRLYQKKSPFKGDRSHFHYRLIAVGLTKSQAVWFLYFLALLFGSLGVFSSSYFKMFLVLCLITVIVLISLILKIKNKNKIC